MSEESKGRRLRAIFKNAVVWGVSWGALGTAVASLFRLSDKIPFGYALLDGLGMGIRIGVVGAIAGAAFSSFISLAYRGKRLAEISALRFGIGGAVFAGLLVPLGIETIRIIGGDGFLPLNYLADDFVLSTVFGGLTAAGTMVLAQRDELRNPVTVNDLLDQMEQQSLSPGEAPTYSTAQGARSVEHR
ncbi:MAG TPA: hypothetical protein VF042_01285 [Gemmatimonadaceae bacterium]